MKRFFWIVCTMVVSVFSIIGSADQADMKFDESTLLVRCKAPAGHPQISTELFNAGYPHWITNLRQMADDGIIRRVHYLGVLKEGLFIVIEATSRQEAADKASFVIADINAVMEAAIEASGERPTFDQNEACETIEIGPVAILPKK